MRNILRFLSLLSLLITTASCSPTRAALLTGMHEFRNGEEREAFREDIYFDRAMSFMEKGGDQAWW